MPDETFLTALQQTTGGGLGLAELIGAASSLTQAGKPELARQLYRVWIGFNPQHPQLHIAHFNCSGLDTQLGDPDAAIKSLRSAIEIDPDFAPAYINLGGALERRGELDQAIEQWRTAASRPAPINAQTAGYVTTALKQLVRVLAERQRNEAAEAAARQCIELDPHSRDALEQFIALRLAQCKWPVVEPWEALDRPKIMGGIHPLSMAVYTDDPLLQLGAAERYIRGSSARLSADPATDRRHAPIDLENRRLRVGYVSSDLRDHAIGYLMAELFELHDRSKVEVFAYYCGVPPSGALHERIKSSIEHWRDIKGVPDDAAAAMIAADGIDILIDVNGHTRDARTEVFARRPAPIQVNWLGYPGTMGSPFHHYLIADEWIIPPGLELYYTEQVLRLPCYQPNDRKRIIADPRPTRAAAGLPEDAFVFCCFNGSHKISRFTFMRWLEILRRTPGSVLWLLSSAPETEARLARVAEENGIEPGRLIFAPKLANPHHLARYPLADLFLDTSPYGAHTTASDALWMAVPVITLSGRSFASRVCGSLVRSAGLPELVCETPEAYVDKAVVLAADPDAVRALKARLEAGRDSCVLFDTGRLAGALEELYFRMCDDHRQGRLPRPRLDNLEAYFEIGVRLDQEGQEMLGVAGYHELYVEALAKRHLMRPMQPDGRVWGEAEIAAAEGSPDPDEPAAEPEKRRAYG